MKALNKIALTIIPALLCISATQAQIIEEDEVYTSTPNGEVFGRLGTVGSGGGSHTTSLQSLVIGYDGTFANERGRFYFSGLGNNTSVKLDLKLENADRMEQEQLGFSGEARPATDTRKIDGNDFDVRDAFVQYNLPGNITFTAGRRRVAWGQLELFSPINLALPLTPQTTEPIATKINTLVAQDQVALDWFPTERMEIKLYHFFSTRLDWLIEDTVTSETFNDVYAFDDTGVFRATSEPVPVRDITDHTHSAARVMFYQDWGTFGFTYHKGRDPLAIDNNTGTVSGPTTYMESFDAFIGSPARMEPRVAYNVTRIPGLPEATHYGFEIAIPGEKWDWKFEWLHQETTTALIGRSLGFDATTTHGMHLENYYEAVKANPGGLSIPVTREYLAIGASSDREKWRFDLALLGVIESFDAAGDRLIELEKLSGEDAQRGNGIVAPVLNVARYYGGEKQKELGVVFGFLGGFAGLSTYFTANIGENFRYLVGFEGVSNLRDQLLSDTGQTAGGESTERYDLADDISVGFRAGLSYSF